MAQYKPNAGRKFLQLVNMPVTYFEVQNMRPVKGQYLQVSATAIWLLVPGEPNGNILKFLSGKELIGFKLVSKSTKSGIEGEKGLIFNAIGE